MAEIRIRQQSPVIKVDYREKGKPDKEIGKVKTGFKHGVDWSPGIRPILENGVITGWTIEVSSRKARRGSGSKRQAAAESSATGKGNSGAKAKAQPRSGSKGKGGSKGKSGSTGKGGSKR